MSKDTAAANQFATNAVPAQKRGQVRMDNWWIKTELRHIKTRGAMLVYLVLRSYRNGKTGVCYPSHKKLQKDTGLSLSSIGRAIAELSNLELIEVKECRWAGSKRWCNNTYRVFDQEVRTNTRPPSARARKRLTRDGEPTDRE